MTFELQPYHRNVSEADLIADLRRVAASLRTDTVSWQQYGHLGAYGAETLRRRFGAWNAALSRAGLKVGKRWRIPDDELFENFNGVWTHLGHQPRREDLDRAPSGISASTYEQRFRTWRQAVEAFVAFANAEEPSAKLSNGTGASSSRRSALRQPSLRLRFKVMRRDRFTCRHCGASPTKDARVELHVDHIQAWSEDGETVFENLQTLCSRCNLGKSDLADGEA